VLAPVWVAGGSFSSSVLGLLSSSLLQQLKAKHENKSKMRFFIVCCFYFYQM
jgi:hypothetical protein